MFTKLLVPTDGSELSTQAALRVVPLAKRTGASITAVFVRDTSPPTGIESAAAQGIQSYAMARLAEAEDALKRIADAARQEGLSVETLISENATPAKGIVEAARQCGADVIAMGSHGRTGLAKLMVGSVAAEVLGLSPVPVLIIK
jgi:nucleotide-binding universal stress UspA family protein